MAEQYYLVRGDRSGVFAGNIKERNGQEVTLTNVRNIWRWDGAATILQLATEGTKAPNNCMFTVEVPELTILDAIEIVPCSEMATNSIKGVATWRR